MNKNVIKYSQNISRRIPIIDSWLLGQLIPPLLFAISAFAGVMPEDIQATSNQIAETVEVAQGTEVINPEAQPTFKEQLDGLIQFAFTARIYHVRRSKKL